MCTLLLSDDNLAFVTDHKRNPVRSVNATCMYVASYLLFSYSFKSYGGVRTPGVTVEI